MIPVAVFWVSILIVAEDSMQRIMAVSRRWIRQGLINCLPRDGVKWQNSLSLDSVTNWPLKSFDIEENFVIPVIESTGSIQIGSTDEEGPRLSPSDGWLYSGFVQPLCLSNKGRSVAGGSVRCFSLGRHYP